MKVLSRVQREYEQAIASTSSNTLPRNAFSALEQEKLATMLQQATSNTLGSSERSKTLERRHAHPNQRVESGYVSSPDFDQQNVMQVPSRFSAWPEGGRYYPRPESTEEAKARMMHMEAQLSQLTGMVEKALKNKKLGKKTVSFDKSVTYSDDPQPHPQGILITNKNKQNTPTSTAVSSSASSSTSSNSTVLQHRCGQNNGAVVVTTSTTSMTNSVEHPPEMHVNLKRLHKSARELKQEVRVLRRLTQLQSMAMKDLVQDTYIKLREACISFSTNQNAPLMAANYDPELWRLVTDEETFVKELNDLVSSICQLEAKVEETRSGVINKKNKISLVDVESMAYTLSKCSKTVTLLKQAFPTLEANIKSKAGLSAEYPEKRRMTEDFLKRTPDRMENIWRRCKKLTGTLVTLKRLASVQEQRFHPGSVSIEMSLSPTPTATETIVNSISNITAKNGHSSAELAQASPKTKKQSNSRPASTEITDLTNGSGSSEMNKKAAPPPPPPRSSSTKSNNDDNVEMEAKIPPPVAAKPVNVDIKSLTAKARQDALEQRHQELLSRQKQLQEQYERLQNMQQKHSNGSNNGGGGGSSTSSLSSTSSSLSTTAEMKPASAVGTPVLQSTDNSNEVASTKVKPNPPAVPMRTNSSLTNNANNHQQQQQQNDNQKVYQTDII